jgi:DNA repair protein RadC
MSKLQTVRRSRNRIVLVHNHPSGDSTSRESDSQLTRRLSEGARILQINMLDHVIISRSFNGGPGYFSFKEAGLL